MTRNSFGNKSSISRERTVLISCAALALITIQVADWSFRTFPRKLSDYHIKHLGVTSSSLEATIGKYTVLIPAEGPDPNPQKTIDLLRQQDPEPIDPLCSPTSQLIITNDNGPHTNVKTMIMQSLALDGTPKSVGGDEFYVTYTEGATVSTPYVNNYWIPKSPDAVARIVDLDDGRYELHFFQPLGPTLKGGPRLPISMLKGHGGTIAVHLEFTCGVGALWPPAKSNWVDGGFINRHWEVEVDAFMVPTITGVEDRPLPQQFGDRFKRYKSIYSVGNSLMAGWIGIRDDSPRRTNMEETTGKTTRPLVELSLQSLPKWMTILDRLIREESLNCKECALILGSGIWDLLYATEPNMKSHLEAVEKLIDAVRVMAPLADIYWKSITATHIFLYEESRVPDMVRLVENARIVLKYCSRNRAQAFYEAQVELMKRLNVPVIDMFNMTFDAAEFHVKNDAVHFVPKLDDYLMDYFYPIAERPMPLPSSFRNLLDD